MPDDVLVEVCLDSAMAYRNPRVDMGAGSSTSEYRRTVTSEGAIREIVEGV